MQVFAFPHSIQPLPVYLPYAEQEVTEMSGKVEEHKERKIRVFKFYFDDLLYGEEISVMAESKEEAIRTVLETLRERLATAMDDVTDELDDEEYEAYMREGEKMIEET